MSETRDLLERVGERFVFPDRAFDRLERRLGRRRRNRRVGAAILALTVAAVAIGGLLQAIRRGDAPPRPASLPSTPDAWTRVVFDAEHINAISAEGPLLVAVGRAAGTQAGPAVWTSPDGREWERVLGQELGGGEMVDVTASPVGFVAVGSRSVGPDQVDGAVWTSEDGRAWEVAQPDPTFEGASLSLVEAGGPGVMAFGATADGPRAWFSSDGVTWERATVPALPDGVEGAPDVAGFEGRWIAVGAGFMWTSTDGTAWSEVPLDPSTFPSGAQIEDVVGGPHGWVAVGMYRYRQEPGVWTSDDGLTWRRVAPNQDAFVSRYLPEDAGTQIGAWTRTYGFYSSPYDRGGLRAVAAGDGGFVAVGGDGFCSGDPCPVEAAVWTSTDGQAWVRVPTGPVFQSGGPDWMVANGVVASGSRFVAWGRAGDRTTIWISRPVDG